MGIIDKLKDAAGIRTPDPAAVEEAHKAYAGASKTAKVTYFAAMLNMRQELEQCLLPGEEVRYMDGCKDGAFAVTDRRVLYASTMGMEKRSLPIDNTLSVYFDRDLNGVKLRFTADGGRELSLRGVLMYPAQERQLRDALPPGVMF